MSRRILVTGAAGFIGHHIVDHFLKDTMYELVLLDRLDCSGSIVRFQESATFQEHKQRCTWAWWDLKAPLNDSIIRKIGHVDIVFHLAAASHVDRSIQDPMSFVMDNVVGTVNLLDYVRGFEKKPWLFYFSTDEVFGPVHINDSIWRGFEEYDPYCSMNPYAATKAGAEQLCNAYQNTYGIPVTIVRCMNNFGERQHVEKFIPSTIRKVLNGETVYIHSNAEKTMSGSRFYIHARNTAAAIHFILQNGFSKEMYNIVGEKEVSNLEMAKKIASIIGKPLDYEMVDFHSSRPGHDLRYMMSGEKMRQMGWKIPVSFEESLTKTVLWTLEHKHWIGIK